MRRTIRRRTGHLKKTMKRRQYGGAPIDDYKELLTTYAVNDAIHDFEDYALENIEGLLEGVPEASFHIYEDEKAVINSIKIININGI